MKIKDIQNVPCYAYEHKYIVANLNDRKFWFYGAFDDKARAEEVAKTLDNGVVFEVEEDGEEL